MRTLQVACVSQRHVARRLPDVSRLTDQVVAVHRISHGGRPVLRVADVLQHVDGRGVLGNRNRAAALLRLHSSLDLRQHVTLCPTGVQQALKHLLEAGLALLRRSQKLEEVADHVELGAL